MRECFERAAIDVLEAAGRDEATWSDVCRKVITVVGADAASIVVWRSSDHAVLAFEGVGVEPLLEREYSEHYYQFDVLLKNPPPSGSWIVSDERFPEARRGRGPFFGDFLWRHDVRQVLALSLNLGADVTAALAFHRQTASPTRSADLVKGRLCRVSKAAGVAFSSRYGTAQAVRAGLFEAYSNTATFSFVVDTDGCVSSLIPGEPLRACPPLVFGGGRLSHLDPHTELRLRRLVAQAALGMHGTTHLVSSDKQVLRLETLPIPAQGKISRKESSVLVLVRRMAVGELPEIEHLKEVFGLTSAQANVLRLLCGGSDAKGCSEQTNCALSTIRNHIAQLMIRMGCSRQAQLIQMARGLMA